MPGGGPCVFFVANMVNFCDKNLKQTKARKEHRCNFCNYKIRVGETYEKATYAYDGRVYDWKTHNRCSKLANRLNLYDDVDEGVTMDYFMDAVSETYKDIWIDKIPKDLRSELSDLMRQLEYVNFYTKLWFVIRHYKKLDTMAVPE